MKNDSPKWRKSSVVTADILAAIPEDDLASALFDFIWTRIGNGYAKRKQILARLPKGYSVLYHVLTLDGEIGNGGFNQYFFNRLHSDGERQAEALDALGATKHRRILERAFRVRRAEMKNAKLQRLRAERTLEAFSESYAMTKLGACDTAWYALDEDLDARLARFIRKSPELFVVGKTKPRRAIKKRVSARAKSSPRRPAR